MAFLAGLMCIGCMHFCNVESRPQEETFYYNKNQQK